MNTFTRNLIFFLVTFLTPNILFAQQISGVVTNAENNTPIGGANLVLIPGQKGVVTNTNGEFGFAKVNNGNYKLTVSSIGFVTQTINIQVEKDRNLDLNISLQKENKKIDEVTVLGNFSQAKIIEGPIREQASLMPALSKVSQAEIQQQGAVTLIDAMKYIPGGWTETRGRKVKQFFSVRGQTYPYPSYAVNGIWQKEFTEMPYFFNSSNIDEISIVRSSSALLTSLSALTGVIDVKTKRPGKEKATLIAKYGSLNTYYSGASYGNSNEKIAYRAGVNASGADGPEGRNGKERIYNVHGFFDWKLNGKLNWSANLFYLNGMRQLVQPEEPAAAKFKNKKEEYGPLRSLLAGSKLQYKSGEKYSGELHVNYAHRNPTYHNENLSTGTITEYDETDWELTINQINALALSEKNTLRLGVLYNYWIAPDGKRYYVGNKAKVHTLSAVVTGQHNFGCLLFDAGFRLTREYYAEWGGFSIEGSGGKFTDVAAITDEWQSPQWQATAGLSYSLNSSSSLHFSFAGGTVTPRKGALKEDGETPDNETRINLDLGYFKRIGNDGKLTITAFIINRNDAIDYSGSTIEISDTEIMELYVNNDKRNYGIEAEFKSPTIKNCFSFFTNFTLMKGEVNEDGEWAEDDEMPQIIGNVGVNFQKNRFEANAYFHYTGAYENDRFVSSDYKSEYGKAPLGDFLTFDMNVGYRMGKEKNARIFIEGKNIFDVEYQTVAGYPDYGRIVSLGFEFKF